MDLSTTIRKLTPEDAVLWAGLRREALEDYPLAFGASPDDVPSLAESVGPRLRGDDSVIFGAFDKGKLVGIVGVVRESRMKVRHKSQIWGMYVTPSHRRKGVGESLMAASIQQARDWPGVEMVMLSVADVAGKARQLYERIGFRIWGREPRALQWKGRYADLIYMVLELKNL